MNKLNVIVICIALFYNASQAQQHDKTPAGQHNLPTSQQHDKTPAWQLGPVLEYNLSRTTQQQLTDDIQLLTQRQVPITGLSLATDDEPEWVAKLLEGSYLKYTTKPLADTIKMPVTWHNLGDMIASDIGTQHPLLNHLTAAPGEELPATKRPDLMRRTLQYKLWGNRLELTTKPQAIAFQALLKQRNRLLPYIYSTQADTAFGGALIRPLNAVFPDDTNTQRIGDQYMFGPAFLVSPIYSPDNSRSMYLPEGEWMDYYESEPYPGGRWMNFASNDERIPVFVRMGSIVVLDGQETPTASADKSNIEIRYYNYDGNHRFALYDDKGKAHIIKASGTDTQMEVELPAMPFTGTCRIYLYATPSGVLVNGRAIGVMFHGYWFSIPFKANEPLKIKVIK